MTLSDELGKFDTYIDSVVKKIGRQLLDLLGKEKRNEAKFEVNDVPMDSFVVKFKWEDARYPRRKSLNELAEQIQGQCAKLDEELKTKATEFNNMHSLIQQRKKLESGNLTVRDLTNLITQDEILDSEYLTTLIVVVPKNEWKNWEAKYEHFCSFIVPRSSKLLYQDNEHGLFKVVLFKKVVDEFKNAAKEFRFVCRKYEANKQLNPEEQKKLENDVTRHKKTLTRWCNTNFAEAFVAWIHLKCIRCFVESVLRYGLNTRFQTLLLLPGKSREAKLRTVLNETYSWLGKSHVSTSEEETQQIERFYSYVWLELSLDLKYDRD
jgi:V-type H+-transporting ATPase subunit C